MQNIFVLPTPAETRIAVESDGALFLTDHSYPSSPRFANHHIYITNDEDIENKGYAIYENKVVQINGQNRYEYRIQAKGTLGYTPIKTCKKIIMTTDPEFIKIGIQPIPDEFLEWLVLNPTYKGVKVEPNKCLIERGQCDCSYQNIDCQCSGYKIIIPKEEPVIGDGWLSPMRKFEKREDKPISVQGGEDIKFPASTVIVVGDGRPPAKLTLELTQKEARSLLNFLNGRFKTTDLGVTETIEEKLIEFLKPLEK